MKPLKRKRRERIDGIISTTRLIARTMQLNVDPIQAPKNFLKII